MDSRTLEPDMAPSASGSAHNATARPEAIEFVRFCRHRRSVGWPELYDEMCAVAGRGLFRGWGSDELSAHGIGFSLFDMPHLAGLVQWVIADEKVGHGPSAQVGRVPPAEGSRGASPESGSPMTEPVPVMAPDASEGAGRDEGDGPEMGGRRDPTRVPAAV